MCVGALVERWEGKRWESWVTMCVGNVGVGKVVRWERWRWEV